MNQQERFMTRLCEPRYAAAAIGSAFFLWIACVCEAAEAQPGADVAAALRASGLELGYNLDHVEARAALQAAIEADPGDPAAYRLAGATAWIELLYEQGAIT